MTDTKNTNPIAVELDPLATALDQVALRLATVFMQPIEAADGVPLVLRPCNFELESIESSLPRPKRLRAQIDVRTVDSFVHYVARFLTPGTLLVGDDTAQRVDALLDYHESALMPSHSEHRCRLQLEATPEWKAWAAGDKKRFNQADFAQFLEDNLVDIVAPEGATVLEVARSLEAAKAVNFRSSLRLDNGERQFLYEETVSGSAGKGTLKVPEVFTLGLQPFRGSDRYRVEARLRYRIEGEGKLVLWYDLLRPHKVLETAIADVFAALSTVLGLTVLQGKSVA